MNRWSLPSDTADLRALAGFQDAVRAIHAGELIGVPTETVYGLAADATNPDACARIYAAKGRPSFNPLIAHVENLAAAERHGVFNDRARRLADAFWPGPLTLVVPKRAQSPICDLATAGLDTVALRVPSAHIMRALAQATGVPIAAPSANLSGRITGTTADDVARDLGPSLSVLIDGGPSAVGVESTIVGLLEEEPRLLRPGGLARRDIEDVLGCALQTADAEHPSTVKRASRPEAPGMLTSHYAPRAAVRLNAQKVSTGEAVLTFGSTRPSGWEHAVAVETLSENGDTVEAAARLFTALRRLDASGARTIAVMPIPMSGLGEAINDRLRRAAAPRPTA